MWFIPQKTGLSSQKERIGPPLEKKNFVDIFKNKYKKTLIKNKRIVAIIPREHMDVNSFTRTLLKNIYFKNKIQKINIKK